jgi:hypothetical protein
MVSFCKYCGFVGTNDQMMGHAENCPPEVSPPDTVVEKLHIAQQAQPESVTYCDNRFCVNWDCGVCELDQCCFVAA